jgi:PhzF family phenazine biosynthesis protein
MGLKIVQVDAFTEKPFAGNPAVVCILPEPRDETWMQNIAREMNLSETAFLVGREDAFELRWFTPAVEVDLCGHATLASAHVLWEEGHIRSNEPARFHTKSGLLTAGRDGNWIELDFPAILQDEEEAPAGLLEALGVEPDFVGRGGDEYLVEVKSEDIVRNLDPDFTSLKNLPMLGVIVTSVSASQEYDFVSRFFAPGAGIDEDPVTGAAHCRLGPYWKNRLGKDQFVAYQASSRGGVVRLMVKEDRVLLSGQAVTVMRGELFE